MSPPSSVSPEAAFIAAAAASQIVTNDHDSHADTWYDQHGVEPPPETAMVSPLALALVNSFLDQLLFNFLSAAQSTTLSALRPAVSEVLKPKLAKDAMNQADEELREYLGGEDDEDSRDTLSTQSPRNWDLELVWKRTRLRCMVYSSLGDMEEEDEDFHVERENLEPTDERPDENVSPAVAIFLTSILEFMGEQALVVAGQAAYHRIRTKYEKDLRDDTQKTPELADRIVVEELDMERVALDRTLGRLWRAWKKRIRSPIPMNTSDHLFSRSYSGESVRSAQGLHIRQESSVLHQNRQSMTETGKITETVVQADEHQSNGEAEAALPEDARAASIPLPMGPDDVIEILIPGLACYSSGEDEPEPKRHSTLPPRPKSMVVMPNNTSDIGYVPTPVSSGPQTPRLPPRKRASSLPTPAASPYGSPAAKRLRIEAPGDAKATLLASVLLEEGTVEGGLASREANPATWESQNVQPRSATGSAGTDQEEPEPAEPEGDLDVKRRRKTSAEISALIATSTRSTTIKLESTGQDTSSAQLLVDEADEIEEFSEEPEILTSSRVSISGRSNSPANSERGKPPITIGIPSRTASLRVIEVSSPRSPVARSRGSSVEAQERSSVRSSTLSRADSVSTPPIVEESRKQPSPTKKTLPATRPTARLYKSDSISEAEEVTRLTSSGSTRSSGSRGSREYTSAPAVAAGAVLLEPKSTTRYEDLESEVQSSRPIFGSVLHHTSPPQSPVRPPKAPTSAPSPVSKVTIRSSATQSGTLYFDENPTAQSSSTVKSKPPPLALPERSATRQTGASTPSPIQPTTIGHISVDRPSTRSPRQESTDQQSRERHSSPISSKDQSSARNPHESVSSLSSLAKLKPIRTSQESTSQPQDVARNFEQLIQSDQTIQYTLTPESMRDIDSSRAIKNDSPVLRPKSRKSDDVQQQLTDRSRSSPSSTQRPVEILGSTSISRSSGLNSHPIGEEAMNGGLSGPIPRAPPTMPGKPHRGSGPQARDARVPRESLADFAEFIRATGPTGNARVSAAAAGSRLGVASGSKMSVDSAERTSVTNFSNPSRPRYQARDAVVDNREDTSDLIDFIRRGPPNSGSDKNNPRIPRTVAPFRTTMDSDQFASATGGKAVDATTPDIHVRSSATTSVMTVHSVQSSINSSSALLRKDKALPANRTVGTAATIDGDSMTMPKRKTRRVRDPYAIDLSDDDEMGDDLAEEPTPNNGSRRYQRQQQPQEESLADFLRNVAPPAETGPVPFHVPQAMTGRQGASKKKSSTTSLMARFTRKDSSGSSVSPTFPGFSSTRNSVSGKNGKQAVPMGGGGGGRGYIPIQVNMPPSSSSSASERLGTSATNGAIPRGASNMGGGGGRLPMKRFEPREAVSVSSPATAELAEFLRSSEPPRDFRISQQPQPYVFGGGVDQQEGSGPGLSKVFSRRKKSTAL